MTNPATAPVAGSASTLAGERLVTLDVIRGVAVLGILLANLPGFALPDAAQFSPLAWGGSGPLARAIWYVNFVLVEGKMRALFSMMFGASLILMAARADAQGHNPAALHLRRMAVLFVIGCLHYYLLWTGDILSHYALVGCAAFAFVGVSTRVLLLAAGATLAAQVALSALDGMVLLDSAARDTPNAVAIWDGFAAIFGSPERSVMQAQIDGLRGGFLSAAHWRWDTYATPLGLLPGYALETLSAMLLGMAGMRSGLFTEAWSAARYRRWAVVALGIALPAYALLGAATMTHGFDQRWVYWSNIVIAQPFRLIAAIGYAAIIVLVLQHRPLPRLTAVGRMALTNYLGTTIVVMAVFAGWGMGQFGQWSRASLYLLVLPIWVAMLAGSASWLSRYRIGPLEWIWRRGVAALPGQP